MHMQQGWQTYSHASSSWQTYLLSYLHASSSWRPVHFDCSEWPASQRVEGSTNVVQRAVVVTHPLSRLASRGKAHCGICAWSADTDNGEASLTDIITWMRCWYRLHDCVIACLTCDGRASTAC
jgi:hypothetical protein